MDIVRRRNTLAPFGFASLVAAALLAGCAGEAPPPPVATTAAPAVNIDQIVGKWGLAAYHRDSDRDRTVKEAKAQCGKPVVINKGPTGGVMMYLADNPKI